MTYQHPNFNLALNPGSSFPDAKQSEPGVSPT